MQRIVHIALLALLCFISHVHALDLSPDGSLLAVCNTADGKVQLFDVHASTGLLTPADAIAVGYDPVSVRFRTNSELWVVNLLSDSVSVIVRLSSSAYIPPQIANVTKPYIVKCECPMVKFVKCQTSCSDRNASNVP